MAKSNRAASKSKATKVESKIPKTHATSKAALMSAIGQLCLLFKGPASFDKVARRAGYGNATNGSFKKALKRAEQSGLLKCKNVQVELTDEGWKLVDMSHLESLPKDNTEAMSKIKNELSPKMRLCLDFMADGEVHPRAFLAEHLGYKSEVEGGFRKLLDRIRVKGYLEHVDKCSVKLTNECFPFGRPDLQSNDLKAD